MTRIWSTDDVHPRDRLAYWVDGLADAIVHLDCEPRSNEPFGRNARSGTRWFTRARGGEMPVAGHGGSRGRARKFQ
jgi:hypothetical protein